jgi:hypothetical protein
MFEELGGLFAPTPTVADTPNPELKSQWDGFLQNPANRAGLLAFGLKAMQGSWAGPAGAFAEAAGSGVEAASNVEAENYERTRREAEFNERQATVRGNKAERDAERADREAMRKEERDLRRRETALRAVDMRYDRLTKRLTDLKLKATEPSLGIDEVAESNAKRVQEAEIARLEKEVEALDRRRMELSGEGGGPMPDAGPGISEISAPVPPLGVGSPPAGSPPAAPVGAAPEGAPKPMPVEGGGGIIGGPLGWFYSAVRRGKAAEGVGTAPVAPAAAPAPAPVAGDPASKMVSAARANPALMLNLRKMVDDPTMRPEFEARGTTPEAVKRLLEGK